MSERYSRLFSLPENLYVTGCPVVISAGALLKDNQTGQVLAQLKIKNILDKHIKALTVRIELLDAANKPIGNMVDFNYLDLNVARNGEFGQKTPIMLPDSSTRAFNVSVTRVIFSDSSEWTGAGDSSTWAPLAAPLDIWRTLKEGELVKEYQIKFGNKCKNAVTEDRDLWICSCGHVNHEGESFCPVCRNKLADFLALDIGELTKKKDERLKKEAVIAAELAKAEAKKKAKAKRRTKIWLSILIPIFVVIIFVVAYFATIPARTIKKAEALANEGDYLEAIAILDELNKPEKTDNLRQLYIDTMESEIQDAIKSGDYVGAIELIDEYSVLKTAYANKLLIQSLCSHNFEIVEQVQSTCEEKGYTLKKCSVCDYETQNKILAKGHKYISKTVKDATCSEYGVKVTECSNCGDKYESTTPKASHKYETVIIKDATCTEAGTSQDVCKNCGYKYEKTTTIKALGHTYTETVKYQATCSTNGVTVKTCTRCQHSYEETIPTTSHTWKNATCYEPQTCTVCHKTSGSALGHTTDTAACSRCGTITFKTLTFSGRGYDKYDYRASEYVGSFYLPKGEYKATFTCTCKDFYNATVVRLIYNKQQDAAQKYYNPLVWLITGEGITIDTQTFTIYYAISGHIEISGVYDESWTLKIEAIG